MKAILLTEENFDTILQECHDITLADLTEIKALSPKTDFYFIPVFVTPHVPTYNSWVVTSEDSLRTDFTYDLRRIKTQFVELH